MFLVFFVNVLYYSHKYFEGFVLKTNKQDIKIGITKFGQCCEKFGVMVMAPREACVDAKDILGAEIISINWGKDGTVDKTLHPYTWTSYYEIWDDKVDVYYCPINIMTNLGLIQVLAYNEHNGYYPHYVYVEWEDYWDLQTL